MLVPTAWLKKYVGRTISDAQVVTALEASPIEVEEYRAARLLDKHIVVGLVKKVMAHPDVDRLRLAEVDDGQTIHSVVCGAPNLEKGQKIAFAQIGAKLPDGQVIKPANLRGQSSNGMICSIHELGLGDDHSGILVLPNAYKVGALII